MSVVGMAQLVLLACLAFALSAAAVCSWLAPGVLAVTERWSPERRYRALLVLAVSPFLLGVAGVIAALAPSLLSLVRGRPDHCLVHGDGHVHLCFVHLPSSHGGVLAWLVLVAAGAWLAVRAKKALGDLHKASRLASGLRKHSWEDAKVAARVIPTDTPLCLLVGLSSPWVLLSKGLMARIAPDELDVILRHERAHTVRHDTLLRLFARVATLFMWASVRARLLATLELASERSCDEVAARQTGDRLRVAETILKVERLLHAPPVGLRPLTVSFGGNSVPERVSALLEPSQPRGHAAFPVVCLALALLGTLAAMEPLHHLTESLLSALAH